MNSQYQRLRPSTYFANLDTSDRAYISAMVKDHKEDIAEFEKEASSGSDPNIKAFAAKTLPTLKEHLTMAESTARQVGL